MGEDHFEDVRGSGELSGAGILAGDAVEERKKAIARMSPDGKGIDYQIYCGECNIPNKVTVSWEEFLYAACRHVPFDRARQAAWKYEGQFGGFHPNVGCGSCQMALMLIITPDEAKRQLKAAEQGNKLPLGWSEQQAQVLRQRVATGYQR